MTLTKAQQSERDEAIAYLREIVKPGDTLYTSLAHVSRSGMLRHIHVYVITDNQPRNISGWVAAAIGYRRADSGALKVSGAGMDMGFHVVYSLSSVLYRDGFRCLGKGTKRNNYRDSCPSNDHSNDYGAFSRDYDDFHAPDKAEGKSDKWWVSAQSSINGLGLTMTDEMREERHAYQEAKSAAWQAAQSSLYSRRRVHTSGGYALSHKWMG